MARYTLEITDDIDASLSRIARRSGISKGEAMRRAFALLEVADQAEQRGYRIALFAQDGGKLRVTSEVVAF